MARLRIDVQRWAAIPRDSPGIYAGTYGKPPGHHSTHTRAPSVSIVGGYPGSSSRAEPEDKYSDQSHPPGDTHS